MKSDIIASVPTIDEEVIIGYTFYNPDEAITVNPTTSGITLLKPCHVIPSTGQTYANSLKLLQYSPYSLRDGVQLTGNGNVQLFSTGTVSEGTDYKLTKYNNAMYYFNSDTLQDEKEYVLQFSMSYKGNVYGRGINVKLYKYNSSTFERGETISINVASIPGGKPNKTFTRTILFKYTESSDYDSVMIYVSYDSQYTITITMENTVKVAFNDIYEWN